MNRRGFLGAITGIAASLFALPVAIGARFTGRSGLTLSLVRRLRAEQAALNDFYGFVVHPSQADALRKRNARWEWREAWGQYRIARRDGAVGEMTPREILRTYEPAALRGEVGRLQGMRFINDVTVQARAKQVFDLALRGHA